MTMTVEKLHRMLGNLVARGHGRKPVCIDKSTFRHPLEADGDVILGVECVLGPKFIPLADDDGGQKFRADGTEAGRMTVVIVGAGDEREGV